MFCVYWVKCLYGQLMIGCINREELCIASRARSLTVEEHCWGSGTGKWYQYPSHAQSCIYEISSALGRLAYKGCHGTAWTPLCMSCWKIR